MSAVGGLTTHSIIQVDDPKKSIVRILIPFTYKSPSDERAVDLAKVVAIILASTTVNLNPFSKISSKFFGIDPAKESKLNEFNEDFTALIHLLQEKKYDVFIETVIPLDQAVNALKIIKEGKSMGCVVVTIDDEVTNFYASSENFKRTISS